MAKTPPKNPELTERVTFFITRKQLRAVQHLVNSQVNHRVTKSSIFRTALDQFLNENGSALSATITTPGQND